MFYAVLFKLPALIMCKWWAPQGMSIAWAESLHVLYNQMEGSVVGVYVLLPLYIMLNSEPIKSTGVNGHE